MTGQPGPSEPTRAVLDGIPKIGYHVHLCPFPGSLVACLEYLGDPCDYDYVMGVTGAAFRRFWQRDDGGNVDLMYLAPEPHRRAFWALGYGCRTVPCEKGQMVQAIKESVTKGIPVLSFGIIGPPECGIVAGYDQGGETLFGYSYFQDPSIPGYYEQPGWFEKMHRGAPFGLIAIGEKRPRPAQRQVLASSLEWAIDLARMPVRPRRWDHASGLAAYEAWAAGMEVDADYPKDNAQVLGTRVMVHGDQTVMLDERRSAAGYLRGMAGIAPEAAAHLESAAALYDQAAEQGAKVWLWGHEMGPEVGQALADPATRRGIARAIRAAGEIESRAVESLEKALAQLK